MILDLLTYIRTRHKLFAKECEKNNLVISRQFPASKGKIRKAVFCICITCVKYIQLTYVKGTEKKNYLVTPWRSVISWIYTMTRRCFCAQWFHDFFSSNFCCFEFLLDWRNFLLLFSVFDAVRSQLKTDSTKNCLLNVAKARVYEKNEQIFVVIVKPRKLETLPLFFLW